MVMEFCGCTVVLVNPMVVTLVVEYPCFLTGTGVWLLVLGNALQGLVLA